jgi:predicted nucleic acid-binding protein
MVKAVIDTNILVDYLRGVDAARIELGRYRKAAISVITWMEVMVGASPAAEAGTRAFLAGFELIGIDAAIAEQAVKLRRARRIKLPDAVIWATARENSCLLVTRNSRDIDASDPGVRIPYTTTP